MMHLPQERSQNEEFDFVIYAKSLDDQPWEPDNNLFAALPRPSPWAANK